MRIRCDWTISALEWATIVQFYVEHSTSDFKWDRSRLMRSVLYNVAKRMVEGGRMKNAPKDDIEALRILKRYGGFDTFTTFEADREKLKRAIQRKGGTNI